MPFFFYRKLFDFASTNKYVLFVGDFNAHHSDWHDPRTDSQGENISRVCDAYHLVIANDSSATFLSSPSSSSSVIDLSIVSRSLALLVDTSTIQDLHGSDHFPIRVTVRNTCSSYFRFSYKYHFTIAQLSLLQARLIMETPKFLEELTSQSSLDPIQKYKRFCALLREIVSSILTSNFTSPHRKRVSHTRTPAPWWNDRCAEAVEHRRTLRRIYKANPSWNNCIVYKRGNTQC